jgi:hypothetical protein
LIDQKAATDQLLGGADKQPNASDPHGSRLRIATQAMKA